MMRNKGEMGDSFGVRTYRMCLSRLDPRKKENQRFDQPWFQFFLLNAERSELHHGPQPKSSIIEVIPIRGLGSNNVIPLAHNEKTDAICDIQNWNILNLYDYNRCT